MNNRIVFQTTVLEM